MNWLEHLGAVHPVVAAILTLCAVAALGLAIGSVKIRGVGLGVAGTLFAGIALGHFGMNVAPDVRAFIQDFGLILFVYTIGVQVGPGFLSSLRRQGLVLNVLAAAVVVLGAAVTVAVCLWTDIDPAAGVGIFSGATTNTPALGAAQQTLKGLEGVDPARAGLPGLAYAVCYPFGIVGVILAMLAVRYVFRVDVVKELAAFRDAQREGHEPVGTMTLEVANPNLEGMRVRDVPGLPELGVVISRHRAKGTSEVGPARTTTVLHTGDTVLAVGTESNLRKVQVIVGRETTEDLSSAPGPVVHRRVVVTRSEIVGRRLEQLALESAYGVTATRVSRADLEMTVSPSLELRFGDMLQLVGTEKSLAAASDALGNSVQQLNHTNLIPIFVGIAFGVLAGIVPFHISGIPAPVHLGLAGGLLVVAMTLSRIGKIGPLLWYMPINANVLLREFGIVLFLSCVGLRSGPEFVRTLTAGSGVTWMAAGAVVTFVPLAIVGLIGRAVLRMNYMNVCGLLSGSMTDPPALAFANSISGSDAPIVAYASVYPLTMLLRIVLAQLIVLLFCG